MNNHTPGAWKYLKNDDGNFSVFPVENKNFEAELLALVFNEDNARLIASAPELYQALVWAAETIKATEMLDAPTVYPVHPRNKKRAILQ